MYEIDAINRIMSFVRFDYENSNPKDNNFIKSLADLWFAFPERKFHEILKVAANKAITEYGLDKID